MKTKQEYNMTDFTGAGYATNETKLSWLIRLGVVCDKN